MGDRICIRLTNGKEVSPTFYGHWCGLRGLKVMIETLKEPYNTIGCCMCNFIVKVTEGKTHEDSYDIWNSDEGDYASDGDWYLWTYHTHLGTWTTTYPAYNHVSMTNDEVESIIKDRRPCLYRTCPCDNYGEKSCFKAFYERVILPMEKKKESVKE